jgi:D-lactate dehydrogenase
VNRRLAPHGKKIGPDPASIGAAKIGGIAANNASGMCCGTAQNSYRTLAGLRVMLADGSLLDTEDPLSVDAFSKSHAVMLGELERLGNTRANGKLAERIRHKFKIKNTTGYSLNALVDYEHPIDILSHLMIGSEGTLGFISRITYNTVVEDPFKASALVFFPDIRTACEAVIRLKTQPVSAVELLDRPALRSVENKPGLPAIMRELGEDAAALLIEVRAATVDGINERISTVHAAMEGVATVEPMQFSTDPATCEMYWKVRKELSPPWVPCGARHYRADRGCRLPDRVPGQRHARPAGHPPPSRLFRGDHFRSCAGRQPSFRLYPGFRRSGRSRPLCTPDGRCLRSGGQEIRWLAQGRAWHRSQHGAVCRNGMG